MKKTFLYTLIICFFLSFLYKSILYFTFDKSIGIVKHLEYRSTPKTGIADGRYGGASFEVGTTPSIDVVFGDYIYTICKMEWGYFYTIPVGTKIEVLKYKNENEFEINSFLYYWFTLNDFKRVFGFPILFTLLYTIYLDIRRKREIVP